MRRAIIAAGALALTACASGLDAAAICERAGGRWAGGLCEYRLTPEQLALRQWCETQGGRYLNGDNTCAFGRGGP